MSLLSNECITKYTPREVDNTYFPYSDIGTGADWDFLRVLCHQALKYPVPVSIKYLTRKVVETTECKTVAFFFFF
jgi:hypothetical protein